MYSMTLNDGTKIDGLSLKNNTLRRAEAMTEEMFRGKLCPVTIEGVKGDDEDYDDFGLAGTHNCMEVCYIRKIDDEYALALADVDPKSLADERRDAQIAYLAMMTGVEL